MATFEGEFFVARASVPAQREAEIERLDANAVTVRVHIPKVLEALAAGQEFDVVVHLCGDRQATARAEKKEMLARQVQVLERIVIFLEEMLRSQQAGVTGPTDQDWAVKPATHSRPPVSH